MVLNDEAHHVWDPLSAWNEAIEALHDALAKRHATGLVSQLDFSATPKDNKGNIFQHVICDTPLGEAVDGGIVKTPIIGRGGRLIERADDNAAYKYEQHLQIGYSRWHESQKEWRRSGKKALLFVMCGDTKEADQITQRLNTDPNFSELNGYTLNLHTNLKGKIRKRGSGANAYYEFVESEKDISDEDLKALRKLSRELDDDTSPYRCIVSVLMLREGWDVRNVTTIIPLRPYSSKANILPEQTLGRGLRRMTLPGSAGATEIVTVVEHSAFVSLYREQLSQEGVEIEVVDADKVPRTTITIFPDPQKDLNALDLKIPRLSQAHHIRPELDKLTFEDIEKAFLRYTPLPLGEPRSEEIDYHGRHLFTGEIVEQMKIRLPLLKNGFGAIAFYREELERICQLRGTHSKMAPLIQKFLTEILFEERVTLTDSRLITRLADPDVREHVRATFVPLIRSKTIMREERTVADEPKSVTDWHPFQVTISERHPVIRSKYTPFNLVTCNRQLEVAFANFADVAQDVVAFCKNAGPQSLRIDYLATGGRLSFYTPDFIVRTVSGGYLLVETKGRVDVDVPLKARAAVEWCKSASEQGVKWDYLYLPERLFEEFDGNRIEELQRIARVAIADLLHEAKESQPTLPYYEVSDEERLQQVEKFLSNNTLDGLPSRYVKSIEEAVVLYHFLRNKDASLSPCFTPLLGSLDDAAISMMVELLQPEVPTKREDQQRFFKPTLNELMSRDRGHYGMVAKNLERTLIYRNGIMPLGLLAFCLDYGSRDEPVLRGVFSAVRKHFALFKGSQLASRLDHIKNFRNTYIAHQESQLFDIELTETELKNWITGLAAIYRAHYSSTDR